MCRPPKFLHQASASSRQSAQFAQLCCQTVTSGTAGYTAYRRNPQPRNLFTPEYKEVTKCAHKVQNMARSLNITPSTAHHIFCPRLFAKNAGVHATWQTLLSDSTQTGKCRQRSAEPANTKFHEYSFQRFSAQTLYPHSCKLCLLMCHKAAIGTNPVTPTEHKTGTGTGCSTNLRLELWLASVVPCVWYLRAGPQQQGGLCCPRTHSE